MPVSKLAILQARMSSSRLPGKVMSDISGKPLLQRMLDRVRRAKLIDGLLVATTTDSSDDLLEQFCQQQDIPCYRGSLSDVLNRYYQAAVQFGADIIIRLTADCPLIDPELIDLTVSTFLGEHPQARAASPQSSDPQSRSADPFHFAANRLPPPWSRTLPIGLDVEVCSFNALQRAWKEADHKYQREHVMPYIYEGVSFAESRLPLNIGWYIQQGTTPRGFKVAVLNHYPDYGSLRWTVDTPADLEFVRQVYAHFEGQVHFTWQDILSLLEKEPGLVSINAAVRHKSAYDVDQRPSR